MSLVLNSTNMTHFVYGIAANVAAVLLYGSNFAPIKRVETGDGEQTALCQKSEDGQVEGVTPVWERACCVHRDVLPLGVLCRHLGHICDRERAASDAQVLPFCDARRCHLGHRYRLLTCKLIVMMLVPSTANCLALNLCHNENVPMNVSLSDFGAVVTI